MQDTTRSAEIQMVFSGQKLDSGMGSIRQGTSITSVSSVGSYTFQVHYELIVGLPRDSRSSVSPRTVNKAANNSTYCTVPTLRYA
jgi:hypothetical protein